MLNKYKLHYITYILQFNNTQFPIKLKTPECKYVHSIRTLRSFNYPISVTLSANSANSAKVNASPLIDGERFISAITF